MVRSAPENKNQNNSEMCTKVNEECWREVLYEERIREMCSKDNQSKQKITEMLLQDNLIWSLQQKYEEC